MSKATSVKLDEELNDQLQYLTGAGRCFTHGIMREAIEQYVEREKKRYPYSA